MKKILIFFFCFCVVGFLQAQTSSFLQESLGGNAVDAPPSNIDLLKKSFGSSGIAAPATSVNTDTSAPKEQAKPQVPLSAPSQTVETKKTASSAAPLVPQKSAVPAVQSKEVVKKKVVSPLESLQPKPAQTPQKTAIEKELETNNALKEGERIGTPKNKQEKAEDKQKKDAEEAAQAELDYAARMLQESKKASTQGRFIPEPASKTAHAAVPSPKEKKFNPNTFRPGVEWVKSNSTHFVIYTQKRSGGIGSSNMSMAFESAYATLRRNIPWMMTEKVRVFVYQDHGNYLKYEPSAKAWTRALAYPTRGEIVVYDEPGKQQELKEVFTHELVHIFTQKYFDKHKTNRLATPIWLDEGLAVYMEDQAYNGVKGGPWANDFKTYNLQRSKSSPTEEFGSSRVKKFRSSSRRAKPLVLMPFGQFMQEGSLEAMQARGKTQEWYFQAYAMVRFLLNPANTSSPSNRMQFEQFTRLLSQGEPMRDPSTGFVMKDKSGKTLYQPYSVEKALGKAYRYSSAANFEDAFWKWVNTLR